MNPIVKKIALAVVQNPAFAPKDITGDGLTNTFCNWATDLICSAAFGFTGFRNMTANQICEWCERNAELHSDIVPGEKGLYIACRKNDKGSGHVAVVMQSEPFVMSGKWGKKVPILANVGHKNGFMGANWAFSQEPQYFKIPSTLLKMDYK